MAVKPLQLCAVLVLSACDRRVGIGVDTGSILAQNMLEGLAWSYCVQHRKMVSALAFAEGAAGSTPQTSFGF